MAEELTDKQQVFIIKYFELGFNATRAAIAAGYSRKTAYSIGSENLKKPEIKAEVERRLGELAMSKHEVLARLTQHGQGDMREFVGKSVNQLKRHPNGNLIKKIDHEKITTTRDGKTEVEEHVKLELYDAQAALVQLGRYHGLFLDKTDLTSGGDKLLSPTVFLPEVETDG